MKQCCVSPSPRSPWSSIPLPLLDFTQKKISKFFQPDSNTITNDIIMEDIVKKIKFKEKV